MERKRMRNLKRIVFKSRRAIQMNSQSDLLEGRAYKMLGKKMTLSTITWNSKSRYSMIKQPLLIIRDPNLIENWLD